MVIRKIIHIDMDCFYAAVETKFRPDLKGKPIGIGGSAEGRGGVLCTANYEARKFKVRSAMSSTMAMRLCPSLILIPPHFELYRAESRAVRQIFERYTSLIQFLSLDEAYLDVTDSPHLGGSATKIAQAIRSDIERERELTASAGIAPNKFLAKIASDWNKPNGQFVVKPSEVDDFIRDLPVERIHGVGKVTAQKMHARGLRTCRDVQQQTPEQMTRWFGSWGATLIQLAHGIDDREVEVATERKSLTVEETFSRDLLSLEECIAELPPLYEDWERRMIKSGCREKIAGLVVKLKFFDFQSTTHEMSGRTWPSLKDFEDLLRHAWDRRGEPVRLIGLGARLQTTNPSSRKKIDLQQLSFAV